VLRDGDVKFAAVVGVIISWLATPCSPGGLVTAQLAHSWLAGILVEVVVSATLLLLGWSDRDGSVLLNPREVDCGLHGLVETLRARSRSAHWVELVRERLDCCSTSRELSLARSMPSHFGAPD